MNRRILVLAVALLVTALSVTGCDMPMGRAVPTPTIVPLAVAGAEDTPTIAPTPTLLKAPTATPQQAQDTASVPPEPTSTPPPPTAPVLKASPEQSRRVEGKVTAYSLNVRSGPSTAYPIVGGLSLGDSVEVVGRNAAGDWLQIAYNGQEGWIAAAYVTTARGI